MKHLDLFSGIGGFALAARWLNMETVAFCEIDPWCRRVLNKNFPNIPIHEDVKKLDGKQYESIDLITAGYPCQPFSSAGKREGSEDDRHLWPEVRRIISEARPTWVLCENVTGHVSMGLDSVLADMEGLGYSWQPFLIPACALGAVHRRERVWILAHDSRERGSRNGSQALQGQQALQGRQDGRGVEGFGRMPALPTPELCRVGDGIPDRVDRLKGLGNAIVPQVASEIMRAIILSDNV